MKLKVAPILFSIFFVLFLFLGVETGENLFSSLVGSDHAAASAPVLEPGEEEGSEVPFMLLIQVDDLSFRNPRLEAVWLLGYGSPQEGLLFFPLLPSQASDGASRDAALDQAFAIDRAGEVGEDFFQRLKERNLAWSGYVVVDRTSLVSLVGSLGGVRIENRLYSPAEATTLWGGNQADAGRVRKLQSQFISGVCERLMVVEAQGLLQGLLEGRPGHVVMGDVTPEKLRGIWQPLMAGGDVTCKFPTLSP